MFYIEDRHMNRVLCKLFLFRRRGLSGAERGVPVQPHCGDRGQERGQERGLRRGEGAARLEGPGGAGARGERPDALPAGAGGAVVRDGRGPGGLGGQTVVGRRGRCRWGSVLARTTVGKVRASAGCGRHADCWSRWSGVATVDTPIG